MLGSRIIVLVTVCALAACTAEALRAQSVLSVEARAGGAVPTGAFRGPAIAEPGSGVSFGMGLRYGAGERLGLVLGFSQHRFTCGLPSGTAGCGTSDPWVYTAWDVGARYGIPAGPVTPWLGVAAVFARVESGGIGGGPGALSDLSAGVETGVGVRVPLGGRFAAIPSARYGWLDARFPELGLARMRWVIVDLAVSVGL